MPSWFYEFKDWYIDKKYKDLKEELTNNDISKISVEEWINQYNKGKQYLETDYAKTLTATVFDFGLASYVNRKCYGIPNGEQISLNHLIAIIVYCGYTVCTIYLFTFLTNEL